MHDLDSLAPMAPIPPQTQPRLQRGVVLLYTLIALVILLIGGLALLRAFNDGLFTAGNIAFKRDLQHRAEVAARAALDQFGATGLASEAARAYSDPARNYSARVLDSNSQGLPLALIVDADYAKVAKLPVSESDGTTVRWIADRLCLREGPESLMGASDCMKSGDTAMSGSASVVGGQGGAVRPPAPIAYRLSVRVDGPRGTQSYFQTTFVIGSGG